MGTNIRPTISAKNKYWISKHRYYELKHFCLQYFTWKKAYSVFDGWTSPTLKLDGVCTQSTEDPTAKYAILRADYLNKIKMIEDSAAETDSCLGRFILKAVTENLSFNYLQTKMGIPCSKDTYYDRYRKFFWILSKKRC